jgi:hypothetical protein
LTIWEKTTKQPLLTGETAQKVDNIAEDETIKGECEKK